MSSQQIEVLVVGAGQAGVAMSEHLSGYGVPHLVVERHRIAERWRSERWDSLVANGPAWHDRFPGLEFGGIDPDGFASKEQVADYFVAYAEKIGAPIRCGVEVTSVAKNAGRPGFRVETSDGVIDARYVVAATGPFQRPVIPAIVPGGAGLVNIHSSSYRRPRQLPDGAVLVVGAGSSGVQIAEELQRSGRPVYLSVGPHDRPPRRYRGRDFVWWLGVLGKWEAATPPLGAEHVTIAVSGARGGHTVDFRTLAASGIKLTGRAVSYDDGTMRFAPDLGDNIARGDANYRSLLEEADAYIERNGLDLPEEPDAHRLGPGPDCVTSPVLELDLARAAVTSVVWATGFAVDYGWLNVNAFDENGKPRHQRGVSSEPGVYFLGLPWQSRRGSSFIWGVWHDAKYLADHIQMQRGYHAYGSAKVSPSDAVVYGR
jgi:putative flavoprotein involved in K+ transport